ncbi:galactose mutarotase [Aerococcaceae bacterium INB8]|uniref:Aldose 1-epimerase n=1 Tax=Ruoffia halotolerans TaxID=2748684 RepID=A0A839A3P9_9LACT|nr:aldose epimerase family protein [Ruoffia halotolerans]MBA5728434.1 galactose mutarotase [Ruoffia halotolerans]
MIVEEKSFGSLNNVEYKEIFITNKHGTVISFSNLGARINRWITKDRYNNFINIILGFEDAKHAYEGRSYYYGASVGRVAGRIKGGHFHLNGIEYQLSTNDGKNHLHGGPNSFDMMQWDYQIKKEDNSVSIIFMLESEKDSNGYPGNVKIYITHIFDDNNNWTIKYQAETDQDTLFNPTNHVYFNLNGNNTEPVTNHLLAINAGQFAPVNKDVTPVGHLEKVDGTGFDLRKSKQISEIITQSHQQIELIGGLDHPFVFQNGENIASLESPLTGIKINMKTTLPAVVVYSHQEISKPLRIWGYPLQKYSGITLETQELPDAINQENFGDIVLKTDIPYESETSYELKHMIG